MDRLARPTPPLRSAWGAFAMMYSHIRNRVHGAGCAPNNRFLLFLISLCRAHAGNRIWLAQSHKSRRFHSTLSKLVRHFLLWWFVRFWWTVNHIIRRGDDVRSNWFFAEVLGVKKTETTVEEIRLLFMAVRKTETWAFKTALIWKLNVYIHIYKVFY